MHELLIRGSPSGDANGALEHLMGLKSRAQGGQTHWLVERHGRHLPLSDNVTCKL